MNDRLPSYQTWRDAAVLALYNSILISRGMKPVDNIGANQTPLLLECKRDTDIVIDAYLKAKFDEYDTYE